MKGIKHETKHKTSDFDWRLGYTGKSAHSLTPQKSQITLRLIWFLSRKNSLGIKDMKR